MIGLLGGAFTAGLVGSPHCIGMCGGFATAGARDLPSAVGWHAGRMTTYAVLGALAGATGAAIPGPPWVSSAVAGALLVWFALRLADLVPAPALRVPGLTRIGGRLARRRGLVGRYAFGAVTGLLPCGLVYAALGVPVALSDPALGALAMVLFGLGTVPALAFAATGLRRLTARSVWTRRGLAALVLAAGMWSVALRSGAMAEEPAADGAPACHHE